jgi:hypothetical protein
MRKLIFSKRPICRMKKCSQNQNISPKNKKLNSPPKKKKNTPTEIPHTTVPITTTNPTITTIKTTITNTKAPNSLQTPAANPQRTKKKTDLQNQPKRENRIDQVAENLMAITKAPSKTISRLKCKTDNNNNFRRVVRTKLKVKMLMVECK